MSINEAWRAADAWRRIQDKPTSITVERDGTDLPAQTVRLEADSGGRVVAGMGGVQHLIEAVVFGIRDHATLADTDLQPGDRFVASGIAYEVIMVSPALLGELQAYAKVRR